MATAKDKVSLMLTTLQARQSKANTLPGYIKATMPANSSFLNGTLGERASHEIGDYYIYA